MNMLSEYFLKKKVDGFVREKKSLEETLHGSGKGDSVNRELMIRTRKEEMEKISEMLKDDKMRSKCIRFVQRRYKDGNRKEMSHRMNSKFLIR